MNQFTTCFELFIFRLNEYEINGNNRIKVTIFLSIKNKTENEETKR
jgi:hypothetical protein